MSDSIEKIVAEMRAELDIIGMANSKVLAGWAERLASLRQVPDGYVLLPRRLTAENGAKGLLSGEFAEGFEMNCGECDSVDEDAAQHCDVCNGHGTYRVATPVGWDTIKDIYRMIVDNLAVEANPAPPTSGFHDCTIRANEDIGVRITSEPPTSGTIAIVQVCRCQDETAARVCEGCEATPAQAVAGLPELSAVELQALQGILSNVEHDAGDTDDLAPSIVDDEDAYWAWHAYHGLTRLLARRGGSDG